MTDEPRDDGLCAFCEPPLPISLSKMKRLAKAMPEPDTMPTIAAAAIVLCADEDIADRRFRRLMTERERRAFALRESNPGGRDGQLLDLSHYVPTPADADRPNGPLVWARLDTAHPIAAMYRRGSLAPDQAAALRRYRAAQVWERYFNRAMGIGGGPGFCDDSVDGSGDPQAAMLARMEATMERLNAMEATGMTKLRFNDLDSVVGYGRTLTEVSDRTGRTLNAVKKSLFSGLDAVSGFSRWDRMMQGVQIVAAHTERRRA